MGLITRHLFALHRMLGRLEAAHRHRRNLGQSGNAMVVVGPLAPTCAGIVGRIASVRANESRTGCWVRLTFTCGRRRLEELGRGMTAARSTMLDNHYLRRTMGQLGRIALHLSRNGRSAPVSPTPQRRRNSFSSCHDRCNTPSSRFTHVWR